MFFSIIHKGEKNPKTFQIPKERDPPGKHGALCERVPINVYPALPARPTAL